jgi:hypothetical protein
MAAAAILLSGALVSWALVSLRQEALLGGERLTNSLAHVIAEQTTRTFQTIDQRLQMAAAGLDRLEASGELNRATAEEFLRSHLQRLPFVRALRVVNAEGLLVYGSDEIGLGATVTDRPYFQIYRTNPETTFYIGAPALSPTGNVWFISASWPLRSATGSFAGVIVAVIDPKYFEKLWSAADLGVGGSVVLFRRDAVFLMRTPWDEGAMGKAFPELSLFTHWLRASATGTFQASGAFDKTPRIFAYRTLPTEPELVVVVGRSYEFVLAAWAKFRNLAIAIWGLASLLVIGLAAFLRRSGGSTKRLNQGSRRWPNGSPWPRMRRRSASGTGISRPISGSRPIPTSQCLGRVPPTDTPCAMSGLSVSTRTTETASPRRWRRPSPWPTRPTSTRRG